MKKYKKTITIVGAIAVLLLLGAGTYLVVKYQQNKKASTTSSSKTTQSTKPKTTSKQPVVASISPYFFPITHFDSRIKLRWFGKYVDSSDVVPDCGAKFVGYHNGDDLEVTTAEKTIEVPVYAVYDGTIRSVSYVSGYGGLLIMQATINGQVVTINYGHVRLSSIGLKPGDSVKAGKQLALLGTGCSTETDGERKHLHLAIHKGSTTDVKGYVPTQAALSDWIDPKALLDSLSPKEPK